MIVIDIFDRSLSSVKSYRSFSLTTQPFLLNDALSSLFLMEERMNDKELVKADLPGGFKDYSPAQVLARQRMMRAIESVYRRFGFVPLQTSIAQRRPVLTGNKKVENRLWNMRVDQSEITTDPALTVTARFDLTVPLARYVAENMKDLTFPFRRYEYGDVFRGESPQAGRFCEFMQFDADIVGAQTGPADGEILVCMYTVMCALGVDRFVIKVNNRKVANGLAERVGLPLDSKAAAGLLRVIDKADKIGIDGVLKELAQKTAPAGEEEAFSFDEAKLTAVKEFMLLTQGMETNAARLDTLKAYFNGEGVGAEGVAELELIEKLVTAGGVPENFWMIDPSVVRGIGYYTGPVFETFLLDKPELGSVYSGGRYDNLVARFTGDSLPAVGASVGVDRLFTALEKLGKTGDIDPDVEVFILTMGDQFMPEYFAMASELRAAGVSVEINMNYQDSAMRAQMTFGLSRRPRILVFYGVDDAKNGTVALRNTKNRKQTAVPRENLVQDVLTILRDEA